MPKSTTFENRIRAAAVIWANGERDADRLAELTGVSARSLYRVATDENHALYPLWYRELETMGYDGDIPVNFQVKARGRKADEEKRAIVRADWTAMGSERRAGFSRRELAVRFAEEVGVSLATAVGWLRRFEREEREELMSRLHIALQDAFTSAGLQEHFPRIWTGIASGGYQSAQFDTLIWQLERMPNAEEVRALLAKTFSIDD